MDGGRSLDTGPRFYCVKQPATHYCLQWPITALLDGYNWLSRITSLNIYFYPTTPYEQDVTQGQFLSGV